MKRTCAHVFVSVRSREREEIRTVDLNLLKI